MEDLNNSFSPPKLMCSDKWDLSVIFGFTRKKLNYICMSNFDLQSLISTLQYTFKIKQLTLTNGNILPCVLHYCGSIEHYNNFQLSFSLRIQI